MNITNRKYWHDRAIDTQKRTEKNYLDVMSDLKAIFKQTVKDFDRLIDKWIADIVDSGDQVLLNDLMNSINSSERRNLKESTMDYYFKALEAYEKYGEKMPDDCIRMFRELSYKSRIDRITLLQELFRNEIGVLGAKLENKAITGLVNSYQDTYMRELYLDSAFNSGVKVSAFSIPTKDIERVIKQKWSGSDFSKRLWQNNLHKLPSMAKDVIIKNMTNQQGTYKLREGFAHLFNASLYAVDRLVKTESTRICNQAIIDSARNGNVFDSDLEWEFVAEVDSRTSDICQEMNGQIIKDQDLKLGENQPPLHPNCRSCLVRHDDLFNQIMSEDDFHKLADDENELPNGQKLLDNKNFHIEYNDGKEQNAILHRNPKMPYGEFKEEVNKLSELSSSSGNGGNGGNGGNPPPPSGGNGGNGGNPPPSDPPVASNAQDDDRYTPKVNKAINNPDEEPIYKKGLNELLDDLRNSYDENDEMRKHVHDFDYYKDQLGEYLPPLNEMKEIIGDPENFKLFNHFSAEVGNGHLNREETTCYRYRDEWKKAERELVGLKIKLNPNDPTSKEEIEINGIKQHFISRVIGSTKAEYNLNLKNRVGIPISACKKVLQSSNTTITITPNQEIILEGERKNRNHDIKIILTSNHEIKTVIPVDKE